MPGAVENVEVGDEVEGAAAAERRFEREPLVGRVLAADGVMAGVMVGVGGAAASESFFFLPNMPLSPPLFSLTGTVAIGGGVGRAADDGIGFFAFSGSRAGAACCWERGDGFEGCLDAAGPLEGELGRPIAGEGPLLVPGVAVGAEEEEECVRWVFGCWTLGRSDENDSLRSEWLEDNLGGP